MLVLVLLIEPDLTVGLAASSAHGIYIKSMIKH